MALPLAVQGLTFMQRWLVAVDIGRVAGSLTSTPWADVYSLAVQLGQGDDRLFHQAVATGRA